MTFLFRLLPTVVAVAAVVLVLFQQSEISALRQQLEQGPQPVARAGAAPQTVDPLELKQLAHRVGLLEQTVARIFRMSLPRPPAGAAAPAAKTAAQGTATVDDLRQDVDALLTGSALDSERGRKRLHDIVRNVQQEVRQERRQRWRQMAQQRQNERLDRLAKEAGLNANQRERLGTALQNERQQRRQLFRAVRDGKMSWADLRTARAQLRQKTETDIAGILSASQLEAYKKMREQRGGHRRHGP